MKDSIFDLAVIGLGYIGLPTAVTFASRGLNVAGVDVNEGTVEAVSRGEVPFVEPDLGEVLFDVVHSGHLHAFDRVPSAGAYIVAVPTPLREDKGVDLRFLFSAADAIAPVLRGGELVIIESTSPPGTTELFGERILESRSDLCMFAEDGKEQIHLAHSPERVLPGRIMIEIVTNDRVAGGVTPEAGEMAKDLYSRISRGSIHVTDAKTAELTKLAENSFRDLNIAFANQLSVICQELGIDVWRLVELANHHPRVEILSPGPGVGGHCIAVDPWFLVHAFPELTAVTRAGRELNDSMPGRVVEQIQAAACGDRTQTIAILGLSFKAGVDDTRESPAVDVAKRCAEAMPHAQLLAVEPHIGVLPRGLQAYHNIRLEELDVAVRKADILVLLVDHRQFSVLSAAELEGKKIIDTKGFWR